MTAQLFSSMTGVRLWLPFVVAAWCSLRVWSDLNERGEGKSPWVEQRTSNVVTCSAIDEAVNSGQGFTAGSPLVAVSTSVRPVREGSESPSWRNLVRSSRPSMDVVIR